MTMTKGRLALAVMLAMALLLLTAVGAGAAALRGAGSVAVEVSDAGGGHFSLALPAGLVDLAVALAPTGLLLDLDATHEVRREIRPFLPALRAAADGLTRCPDATFVEVRDRDETFTVRKIDGRLELRLTSPRERVRITLPLRTAVRALERWPA